jgi:osmotically inducible lipoprotein OsmB
VIGALVGQPLAGAAIGAGAGAAAGAVTSPSAIDLGRPVWER